MLEDCFGFSKRFENRCLVLRGEVNCFNCRFYKPLDVYKQELRKLPCYYEKKKIC